MRGPGRSGFRGAGRVTGPVERIAVRTGLVRVGIFRADPRHPLFHDSGPIERPLFVFPRTSVLIRHEGRRPFVADTDTVTYYNEGQRYTRQPIDPRGDLCEWFALRPDVLRDVISEHDPAAVDRESRVFVFSHGPSDRRSYMLQRLVVRHLMESEAVDTLLVEEVLVEVLSRIAGLAYRRGDRDEAGAQDGDSGRTRAMLAGRIRTYLLERFTASLPLDDIANAVGASVFHACRVFKTEVGRTIHKYRSELRLRRSLELVAESNDLSRVAFELGYSSHSHFTAAFRRAFAIRPSEFRRKASSRRLRALSARLAER